MRREAVRAVALFAACFLSVPVGAADSSAFKMLSLVPNETHACVAGLLTLPSGEALAGVRWLNNDGSAPFSRLLLLEGRPGLAPDLAGTGVVVENLGGGTTTWAEATLGQPVVSTTKFIYAVLVFPAGERTTAIGDGGGPGIGVRPGTGQPPFFISADGTEWVAFNPQTQLMLEPVLESSLGKASRPAAVLSGLAGQVNYRAAGDDAHVVVQLPEFSGVEGVVPNPFNPASEIRYALASPCEARLAIYNLRGQHVRTLAHGQQPAGRYSVVWRGVDERGGNVASGVYFVRLTTCEGEYNQRLTLLR